MTSSRRRTSGTDNPSHRRISRGLSTVVLAVATLGSLSLTACSRSGSGPDTPSTASSSGTITITDHTGNDVEIPASIDRVAVDEIPIASTYLAYFGGTAPHLVGMNQAVVNSLEDTVAAEMAPEILTVETGYYDNGELNTESLLSIHPDVVFYNARNTEHAQMFQDAGIPAVGFATDGDPATVYADWLRLLEQVFQEPGKMDEVIDYGQDLVKDAQSRTARVADADRRTVLIDFTYSAGTMKVAGDTPFFGYWWLKNANAINAATGTDTGLAPVNAEQVLSWDPDVLLINGIGQAGISVRDVLSNSVDGIDLSGLRAVQEKQVFSTELGMWGWFTPNPDAPVIANWFGATVYPEQFADVDLTKMVQDYYRKVYNFDISTDDAQGILVGSAQE